jgi:hypothetical protein
VISWVRGGSAAGLEYAPPHTGASITRLNSGNGVLPIDEPKKVENKNNVAKSGSLWGISERNKEPSRNLTQSKITLDSNS